MKPQQLTELTDFAWLMLDSGYSNDVPNQVRNSESWAQRYAQTKSPETLPNRTHLRSV